MNQKTKNIYSLLAVLIVGYLILAQFMNWWPASGTRSMETGDRSPNSELRDPNSEFCVQVITFAVNPETGEVEEFPTPCDVPEGWEEVERG